MDVTKMLGSPWTSHTRDALLQLSGSLAFAPEGRIAIVFWLSSKLVHAGLWPFSWNVDLCRPADNSHSALVNRPFSLGSGRSKTQGHSSADRMPSNHLSSGTCSPISCGLASRGQSVWLGPAHPTPALPPLLAESLFFFFLAPLLQNKQKFCL